MPTPLRADFMFSSEWTGADVEFETDFIAGKAGGHSGRPDGSRYRHPELLPAAAGAW
ncbi:hypothetical protein AGR1A_Lc80490 [Agrobacterium fabacearum CFBP 5771]|nr:hypothetical protein AGR1A_Lc80490 [Agrobacterium fabacearum CFBP 5771]